MLHVFVTRGWLLLRLQVRHTNHALLCLYLQVKALRRGRTRRSQGRATAAATPHWAKPLVLPAAASLPCSTRRAPTARSRDARARRPVCLSPKCWPSRSWAWSWASCSGRGGSGGSARGRRSPRWTLPAAHVAALMLPLVAPLLVPLGPKLAAGETMTVKNCREWQRERSPLRARPRAAEGARRHGSRSAATRKKTISWPNAPSCSRQNE